MSHLFFEWFMIASDHSSSHKSIYKFKQLGKDIVRNPSKIMKHPVLQPVFSFSFQQLLPLRYLTHTTETMVLLLRSW